MTYSYSDKFKAKMIRKMTGPGAIPAFRLAPEVGVAHGTLSRWLRLEKVENMSETKKTPRKRSNRSDLEKVRLVTEAGKLGDADLGAFLREEGLHEADLTRLREEVSEAALEGLQAKRRKRGPSPEMKKIRRLEKELRRKDKALAETAALLVLQGKVRAFLLAEEEGDMNEDNDC